MRCFDKEKKKAVLYKFNNATVLGSRKFITETNEDGTCSLYTLSFPYSNSDAQPRFFGASADYLSLPIVHIDQAVILPFLDENYYHFSIEGLSQVALVMENSLLQGKNFTFLASPTQFAVDWFNYFGLIASATPYLHQENRYHINELYAVDWVFTDEEAGELHHPEDYYVPPKESLDFLRSKIFQSLTDAVTSAPRDFVVFLHRKQGARTVVDSYPLYLRLSIVAESFGLKFRLHGYAQDTLSGQIELFHRAAAVIGIHGAGFSNLMYCRADTAVIEIPVFPEKASVYSRMSSALGFPYWTVPSAQFYA